MSISDFAWQGSVEFKKVFVETGEYHANGNPKLRPITHRKIRVTNPRTGDEIEFTVTKNKTGVRIRDPRASHCGDRAVWRDGKIQQGSKVVNNGESLLPTEWLVEAGRLVGEERAHALLVEAAFGTAVAE